MRPGKSGSRELREEYYDKRNQAASNRALELLGGGDIDQAFQLADIISDPLMLREFNQQFYPVVYDRAIEMFDSGQEEDAREYMEKYASKSYEYMRKFNQYAGQQIDNFKARPKARFNYIYCGDGGKQAVDNVETIFSPANSAGRAAK